MEEIQNENMEVEKRITFECYNNKKRIVEEHIIIESEFLEHAKKFGSVYAITCPICGISIEDKYVRDGEWNTQLERVTYKNGKKDGIYERYYTNGTLYEKSNYEEGVLNGLCEFWYDTTGRKMKHMTYVNGKLDGIYKYWDQDGNIFESFNYKNGERQ